MADVIDVDKNRETTEQESDGVGRRIDYKCVFFNETDKRIHVNKLIHLWDSPATDLLVDKDVPAGESVHCESFHSHPSRGTKNSWTLEMVMDGKQYSNDRLVCDLWEKDAGTVFIRLYKMALCVDPLQTDGRNTPMKQRS